MARTKTDDAKVASQPGDGSAAREEGARTRQTGVPSSQEYDQQRHRAQQEKIYFSMQAKLGRTRRLKKFHKNMLPPRCVNEYDDQSW